MREADLPKRESLIRQGAQDPTSFLRDAAIYTVATGHDVDLRSDSTSPRRELSVERAKEILREDGDGVREKYRDLISKEADMRLEIGKLQDKLSDLRVEIGRTANAAIKAGVDLHSR